MKKFWSRGRIVGECLEWTGQILPHGYGYFYANGRMYYAHRHSWELTNRTLEKADVVCHHCDNPKCFRPSHLFVGTGVDNMQDAKRKGRLSTGPQHGLKTRPEMRPIGERNAMAKLTVEQVKEIRRLHQSGLTQREVGQQFGIKQPQVSVIVHRKTWRHVP